MNYFEILSPPAPCRVAGIQEFILKRQLPNVLFLLNGRKSQNIFWALLSSYSDMLITHHFGEPAIMNHDEIVASGKNVIREYYTSSWYDSDGHQTVAMRKDPGNSDFAWYRFFSRAYLFALLAGDESLIEMLSNYTESWFIAEHFAMPVDPGWGRIYVSVAASFRSKPLEGQAEMEELIRSSRKRAPKLLFKAWEAARVGDQAEFEKHLRDSVLLHEKSTEIICNDDLIAIPQSVVLAAARRLGRSLPSFEPRVMARLLTSESVGIKQSSSA